MRRLLYITWDGPAQSYLPSLFFPIFAGLSAHGYTVDVLQHTWASREAVDATAAAAVKLGVGYTAHRVSPALRKVGLPAIVAAGAVRVARYVRERGFDTLFPRALIPAATALLARRLTPGVRFVFDADGLMADERVDFAGLSAHSTSYRLLRDVEAEAVRAAEAVITRTDGARAILASRAGAGTPEGRIFVVPNGKDAAQFAPADAASRARVRAEWGVAETAPWLVYVGSLGPQYFPETMLALASEVQKRRPDARFTLFTHHEQRARALLAENPSARATIATVAPERVPDVLSAADLGLAFRATTFSQRAVSPIKVAEYLLCGTPIVATAAGDLEVQLTGCRGALVLPGLEHEHVAGAADWFVDRVLAERAALGRACRAAGLEWFALERCVEGYRAALEYGAAASG